MSITASPRDSLKLQRDNESKDMLTVCSSSAQCYCPSCIPPVREVLGFLIGLTFALTQPPIILK